MPAPSEQTKVYRALQELGLTHWMIRTILLERIHYTRSDIRWIMRRGRKEVRKDNAAFIERCIKSTDGLSAEAQAKWILDHIWKGKEGSPIVQWAVTSDIIRRLNIGSKKSDRLRRWGVVDSLRRHERRAALHQWEERALGAWLRLERGLCH